MNNSLMMDFFLELTVVFYYFYRKRTISEVQLMHNVQEHKQVGERQDWLQEKLKDIIVASTKPQHGQSGNIKNLFPNDVLGSNMWKTWTQPIYSLSVWQCNFFFLLLAICMFVCFIVYLFSYLSQLLFIILFILFMLCCYIIFFLLL